MRDFMQPDRIVVGAFDDADGDARRRRCTRGIDAPVVRTDVNSAEMIKLAANAFLTTRDQLHQRDRERLRAGRRRRRRASREGVGLDQRLGPHFLRAGVGYGGSCFPKDSLALKQLAGELGLPLPAAVGRDRGQRAPEAARGREAAEAPRQACAARRSRCSGSRSSPAPTTCARRRASCSRRGCSPRAPRCARGIRSPTPPSCSRRDASATTPLEAVARRRRRRDRHRVAGARGARVARRSARRCARR